MTPRQTRNGTTASQYLVPVSSGYAVWKRRKGMSDVYIFFGGFITCFCLFLLWIVAADVIDRWLKGG